MIEKFAAMSYAIALAILFAIVDIAIMTVEKLSGINLEKVKI